MRLTHKEIRISAPVERVFEFITTPQNLPSVWPSMLDVTNILRAADGTNSFDWTYKMAGMPFKGHSRTIELEPNARIVIHNERGIQSTFRWMFERKGVDTLLSVDVEYKIPAPLLGKLAEVLVAKINEHELDTLFANIKAMLELSPAKDAGKQANAHP